MKTKTWLLLLGGILAVCLVLSLMLLAPGKPAAYAQVYAQGKLLHTLDLRQDRVVTVTTNLGQNILTVRDGKIAVTQANCPDGHCMKRGFCDSGAQIVCLPHQLVIRFVGEQTIDGISG